MPVQIVLNKGRVPVKVFTKDIEHDAIQQLVNVAQLPIVHGHVAAGKIRLLGVAAPQRFGGALANVRTWKEQGFDVVYGSWRAIMGPKGLSAAQVAYWENAVRKATETAEWEKDLETNYWSSYVLTGAQLREALEKEYADMKVVLSEIGLAK